MSDIPNTGNLEDDIKNAVFDYYETYEHSISDSKRRTGGVRNSKLGTLSPNFVMFEPKFSVRFTSLTASGKKKQTRIREGNFNAIYDKLGERPDWFVLTVGVLDDSETHRNPVGDGNISYGLLFDCLKAKGYDPLWPIRKNNFISKIEHRMGNELLKAFSKKNYKTADGKAIVNKIGKEIVEFVQLFIAGGRKPPLSQETIRIRNWKENEHDVAYPNGIYEPLSETGQLENAIDYDVEYYQTKDSADYWKRKKSAKKKSESFHKEKKRKDIERTRQKKLENAAIKAVRNNKTPQKSLIDRKADKMQEYADKISYYESRILNTEMALKAGKVHEDHEWDEKQHLILWRHEVKKYTALVKQMSLDYGIPIEGF